MTHANVTPNDEVLRAQIEDALASKAPRWLETRRWYGDKGRTIGAVQAANVSPIKLGAGLLALVAIRIEFEEGEDAHYFLPLATGARNAEAVPLAAVSIAGAVEPLVDATEAEWFGPWLLDCMANNTALPGMNWRFEASSDASFLLHDARRWPAWPIAGEQSNTSLRFDDALIVKLVRRLQPGPNPDEEVLKALAAAHFARVPAYAGSASWTAPDGVAYPIALAQAFVPNRGDGWRWALTRLAGIGESEHLAFDVGAEQLLGQRTAELHLALSGVADVDFAPVITTNVEVEREIVGADSAALTTAGLLMSRLAELSPEMREQVRSVAAILREGTPWEEGLRAEVGCLRVRVHGDYHLGQTLRTMDDDWVIIDFEGEPARPVAQRRQRVSALKDVAGMLRSFSYARGVAQRAAVSLDSLARLERWEHEARRAFLDGYRDTLRGSSFRMVPEDDNDFAQALAAWELDKAVYEIAYEVRNRPDWLAIPLQAFTERLASQAPDVTGAASA